MKRSDKESAAADALDELMKKLALVDEKLDALTEKWANVEASFDEARRGNDGDGKTSTSSEGGVEKTRRNENGVESAASPLEKSEKSEPEEKKGRNRDEARRGNDGGGKTSMSSEGGVEKTRRNENGVESAASPLERSEKSEPEEKKGRNRDEAPADEPFAVADANETSFSGPGVGTTLVGVAAGLAAWSILKDGKSEKNVAPSGDWRERDDWDAEDDWDSDDEDEDDDWDSDDGGFDDVETDDSDWGGGFDSGDFDFGGGFDCDFGEAF